MELINQLKYIFKLSRPRFWFYLAGPALIGLVLGSETLTQLLSLNNLLMFLYFLIPANVMVYGVNDFFDRKIDQNNPKKKDKEELYRDSKLVKTVIASSTLLGGLFWFSVPDISFVSLGFFLFLGIFYSTPPLRFKTKPILDSFSNGLYLMPLLVTYSSLTGSLPSVNIIVAGWLWTMAMHTFSAIPDIKPDRDAGINTTATFLGRKTTYFYCGSLWLISAITVGVWNLWIGLLFGLYPLLTVIFYFSDLTDTKAYWYFPYINFVVGMVVTQAALLKFV